MPAQTQSERKKYELKLGVGHPRGFRQSSGGTWPRKQRCRGLRCGPFQVDDDHVLCQGVSGSIL